LNHVDSAAAVHNLEVDIAVLARQGAQLANPWSPRLGLTDSIRPNIPSAHHDLDFSIDASTPLE
jgi:hypothetical protein